MPSDGQSDVRVDSAIEIVFTSEVEIYEPDAIYIQNSHGKLAEDVTAEIDSDAMTLKIKHAVFAESESYMVVIPAGTIRARSGGAENQDINWTFTTCGSGPDESNFEEWYGAPSTVAKTKIWTVKFNIRLTRIRLTTVIYMCSTQDSKKSRSICLWAEMAAAFWSVWEERVHCLAITAFILPPG
jgi:hypothetical protein